MKIEIYRPYEMKITTKDINNYEADSKITAIFEHQGQQVVVNAFSDADENKVIRYMPKLLGEWIVKVYHNEKHLEKFNQTFSCVAAISHNNHGPVKVQNQTYFAYEDNFPYQPFGTTCYAWAQQKPAWIRETLETLRRQSFNKIRMCVFPKSYDYNNAEPECYPFKVIRRMDNGVPEFDFDQINPSYFEMIESRIIELDTLGIEADLILFHPYDRWGFAHMSHKQDLAYLDYVVARFASFKNIWWSMANEYDLMTKTHQQWDELCRSVFLNDPSNHLLSIHNFFDPPVHYDNILNWYDHRKPWITHLSIQTNNVFQTPYLLEAFKKPVVMDEIKYEGNIQHGWGNQSGEKLTDDFWKTVVTGGFATHGETFVDYPGTEQPVWWSHGGKLIGESPARITFLKELLEKEQLDYLEPISFYGATWEMYVGSWNKGAKILCYLSNDRSGFKQFSFLEEGRSYECQWIDAWKMVISDREQDVTKETLLTLPSNSYQAVLFTRNEEKSAE